MSRRWIAAWVVIVAGAAVAVVTLLGLHHWRPRWSVIQGAVFRQDDDSRNELPIAGVLITASHGNSSLTTRSDAAGYFRIAFPETVLPGQTVGLTFQHEDYQDLNLSVPIRFRSSFRQLVVAAMTPIPVSAVTVPNQPLALVSNIRVRYTVNSHTDANVGSAVKIFKAVNRGNVPCRRQAPCSPDGFWKASTASVTLDAGAGNEFRDARASCIAGPCPFTQIDSTGFATGGRTIVASATDWSDTATFLLQAEVFHTEIVSNLRESYPVVFGRNLNFTVPPTAEGVSLEAEVNGEQIVFPLGPDLYMSWATCTIRTEPDAEKSAVYQCELKPGYRF